MTSFQSLETEPPNFRDIAELAARLMTCKAGFFSVFGEKVRRIHSAYGIEEACTARKGSICESVYQLGQMLVISDAESDPDWRSHPLVVGAPHVRAYAGVPVRGFGGVIVGTLCVFDTRAHTWSTEDLDALQVLAGQIERRLDLRRALDTARQTASNRLDISEISGVVSRQTDINARILHDFRNILAAIQANADFLPTCTDANERAEATEDIREACRRGMTVINELESFSIENRDVAERLINDTEVEVVAQ